MTQRVSVFIVTSSDFFVGRVLSLPRSAFSTDFTAFFRSDRRHFFPLLVAFVDAVVLFPNSGRHALAGLRKGVDVATDFGELVYLSQKVIDIMGGA